MPDRDEESGIPGSSISGSVSPGGVPLRDIRYRLSLSPLQSSSMSSNPAVSTGYGSISDTEKNSEDTLSQVQDSVLSDSLSIPIKKLRYPLASSRGASVGQYQAAASPSTRTIPDRESKSDESIKEKGTLSDKKGTVLSFAIVKILGWFTDFKMFSREYC